MPFGDPPPRFDQVLRRAVEKTRERRKFDAACRAAIHGKSRDEAREIMIEEYRKIGQEPPGQPMFDRRLDLLLAPRTPTNSVSDVVEGVSVLVGAATRFKKLLEGPTDSDREDMRRGDLHLTPDWHHTCPVELVDDAQSWIADVPVMGIISYRDLSPIRVNVQATATKGEGGVLMVTVGDRPVGTLSESGSDPFWAVLQLKNDDAFPVGSTGALRSRDPDGQWRLDLGAPKDVRPWPRFDDWPDEDEDGGK
jgi:hypothetical protein